MLGYLFIAFFFAFRAGITYSKLNQSLYFRSDELSRFLGFLILLLLAGGIIDFAKSVFVVSTTFVGIGLLLALVVGIKWSWLCHVYKYR